jgi:hypothetical protein
MVTKNVAAGERSGLGGIEKAGARKAYQAPELFAVGSALKLVQGNQIVAPYRDVSDSGYSHWPHLL